MIFDIVVPIKDSVLDLALNQTIPSLFKHLSFRKLIVIAKKNDALETLKSTYGDSVLVIDEDKLSPTLTLQRVKTYMFERTGSEARSGWYFQQFLKLGVAKRDEISDHYLVWDADSIILNPLDFFDYQKRVFVATSSEHHPPYFDCLDRLYGIKKQVDFSFISEHLMFNKVLVNKMIDDLPKGSEIWWEKIMNAVGREDIHGAGFSEYETYGNYVYARHPGNMVSRKVPNLHNGKELLGSHPNQLSLWLLSFGFYYVSFETAHVKMSPPFKRIYLFLRITLGATIKKLIQGNS